MTTPEQLISIIKAVINNEKTELHNVNWAALYELSSFHSVSNFLLYAVNDETPADIKKKISADCSMATLRSVKYDYDTKKILNQFEANKIAYMPLKGYIMRDYYSSPDMRTMCDIDILIKDEDSEKIKGVMADVGYEWESLIKRDDELTFNKRPFCCYEMHKQLVSDSHSIIYKYYGNGWDFAKKDDDNDYGYHLTNEDFFVFLFAHFTKHYTTSGIGLRPIIDIYVFLEKFRENLDWNYIDAELDKLKFREFAHRVIALSDFWFGNGRPEPDLEEIGEYILNNGTYGTVENSMVISKMKQKKNLLFFFKEIHRLVFISYDLMADTYPVLKKHRWLTGFYRVKRVFGKLKDGTGKMYLDMHQESGKESINKTQEHFKKVGLEDFK